MGVFGLSSTPTDPGPGFPSIFKLPEMEHLLKLHAGGHIAAFDQCEFGAPSKKATMIASNLPRLKKTNGLRCQHPPGSHTPLQGVDETRRFRTSYAMEYPPGLCEELALSHLDALQTLTVTPLQKVRAPPIPTEWMKPRDWQLLFKSRWGIEEHQNVLEGRTIVNLGGHLARSSKVLGSALLGAYGFSRVLRDLFERPEQFTSASPTLSPTRDVAHGSRNPPQLPMGSHRRERSRWSISRGKNWGSPRRPVQEALRAQESNRQRAGLPRCISRPRIASGRLLLGMMLIINMPVMCVAPRPRVARPKLLSRGPGAWTRSTSEDADRLGSAGATRLLIHSVSDKTIDMYLKAVRPFVKHPPASCDFSRNPTRMGSCACQLYG